VGGYEHTLREICQQPELWPTTAAQIGSVLDQWKSMLADVRQIILTGSGSSLYAGELIAPALQHATNLPVHPLASGEVLLFGGLALPPVRPLLVISFARSGNSPESSGLIQYLLDREPEARHLVLTCNRFGRLARLWGAAGDCEERRVQVITLDDRTCDRSLVMTSSFTNLAFAGLGFAFLDRAGDYAAAAGSLARACNELLSDWADLLAQAAEADFQRLIVLGDGGSFGAARESALKMLEMTDGRVLTMAETSLGFRHGPMCAFTENALFVMFLSSDPVCRSYQVDLLEEIRKKKLGGKKIVVGAEIPRGLLGAEDIALDLKCLRDLSEPWFPIVHTVVGQLLAFFRSRFEGLRPDCPAANGSISRVVPEFPLYGELAKVGR